MLPTLEQVVDGTVDTLRDTVAPGVIDNQERGASTWALSPDEGQQYWIVDYEQAEVRRQGTGGSAFGKRIDMRLKNIIVHVWEPWSFDRLSSVEFRDALFRAQMRLTERLGLGVCAKMIELPALLMQQVKMYSSLHLNDDRTECHYGKIGFQVAVFQPITAE